MFSVRIHPQKLIIEDDFDDEDSIYQQLSEQWFWEERNNKLRIWKYIQTSGIRAAILDQLGGSKRELDFFNIMFDNVCWDNIVQETNQYTEKIISYKHTRKIIDERWIPIDCNEIKIYFPLCIIMQEPLQKHPYLKKSMPLRRFLQISGFLHFANNNVPDNRDKLRKVRPVINYFNEKFKDDQVRIYQ